jgi:thioredoxin 1
MKELRLLSLVLLLMMTAGLAHSAQHEIYPDPMQAKADIAAALHAAAQSHKRVLIIFGGNWCPNCQALDQYSRDDANRLLIEANFMLAHVNIGHIDANLDLAGQYKIQLSDGIPAAAVLNERGQLLHSGKIGDAGPMKHIESSDFTAFLKQWKP